jgi:hypothetical protein
MRQRHGVDAQLNDLLLNAKSVQGLHHTGATGTVPPISLRWRPSNPQWCDDCSEDGVVGEVRRTKLNCVSYR